MQKVVLDQGSYEYYEEFDDFDESSEKASANNGKRFGFIFGFAITLNYLIGTGIFSIPFAFFHGGYALSLTILIVYATLMSISCFYILEILSRANGVLEAQKKGISKTNNRITSVKIDYVVFCELFGGKATSFIVQIIIAIHIYGLLWAYAAIFSSTLVSYIYQMFGGSTCDIYHDPSSSCYVGYYLCIGLFFILCLLLTLVDLAEQKFLQLILSSYRIIAFTVMIITGFVGMAVEGQYGDDPQPFTAFNFDGFPLLFSLLAFAMSVHFHLPHVVSPLRDKSRGNILKVVFSAFSLACLIYLTLGLFLGFYFNSSVNPLIVLNYVGYTGHGSGWGEGTPTVGARIILTIVAFFPIFNLLNDFPLVGITLSNNLEHVVPNRFMRPRTTSRKVSRFIVRLCVVGPPMIAAAIWGKLEFILTFTGIFAYILVLVIPALFSYLSRRYMIKNYGKGSENTEFSGWYSSPAVTLTLTITSIILFIVDFVLCII